MAIVTYRQALHDTLAEEMRRDASVILLGEEIGTFEGSYKITAGLLKEFGADRVMDTPIAEEGFVGAAIGAAMLGLRPVVEIMTVNFSLLAIDQVVNHAAKIHYMFGGQARVPMVLRTPEGGGQQLAATHSQNFSSWYAYVPGLKVVAPATPADARGLLKSSIRDDDPVIFLENLALYNTKGEVPDLGEPAAASNGHNVEEQLVPIGKAAIMKEGSDLTLVAYSRMSVVALEVARRLEKDEGISIEVIDVRSLRPLDRPTLIESVKKTSRAVIVEEDWYSYGVGAELVASIQEGAFDYLDAPIKRVAQAEVPLPYAKVMEQLALPKAQNLVEAIKSTLAASGYRAPDSPLMADVTMPRLSDTMEEGTIASWLKKPGQQIKRGEVIAQIETDKATMDLTAFEAGTLQEILAPEGATVAIGQPVARIGKGAAASAPPGNGASSTAPPVADPATAGAPAEAPDSAEGADSAPADVPAAAEGAPPVPADGPAEATAPPPTKAAPATAAPGTDGEGKTRASPMARHIAAEHGLDLGSISGSGPQGRVIRADVEAVLESHGADGPQSSDQTQSSVLSPQSSTQSSPGEDDERVTLSQMRRTIARRMAESTRTVPHFFLTITVDASELVKLRKQVLEQTADEGIKISFNDLVVKAAALALRKVPEVNVSFAEDSLIRHKRIHIGVAVATDRGLIVPVIRDVDQKSLSQISRETRDLAERANAGKLQPNEYTGGTFTISNLGMFGVKQFNAVINPPEAAILAVGAITREPAEHDGEIVLRERLKLTLSVDHRALDGAIGARYLQAIKQLLEKPMLLLV